MLFFCSSLIIQTHPQRLKQVYILACAIVLACTTKSLTQFIINYEPGLRMIGSGALSNPLLSSHIYGFFATLFITLFITQKKLRALNIIFFLLLFFAIIATGSRTPLLALVLVSLWLTITNPNKKSIGLVLTIAISAAVSLYLAPLSILERGLSYRPEIWSLTIDQILQHPFLGHGYNTPLSVDPGIGIQFREPHNFELGVIYELGLIGFLIWLSMHLCALWRSWKSRSNRYFILASSLLVFGIGAGLTEGGGVFSRPKEHWFLIWIPLALIYGVSKLSKLRSNSGTDMIHLAIDSYTSLTKDGETIEEDGLGPKVICLKDGSFLKIFRRKSIISSASITPYAKRFAINSKQLNELGLTAPEIKSIYKIPDGSTAVQYKPLPGETLRKVFNDTKNDAERDLLVKKFGQFIAELHKNGIYFRSLHLGNVLVLPSKEFGLIDLADLRVLANPLPRSMRLRNLKHMQRYAEDKRWLFELHREAFILGYSRASSANIVKALRRNLESKNGNS
jgi:tRNA A-37 threonylcarbamoyl transferase component Bud32